MANLSKLTMKLFGVPYQFPETVDPRVNSISSIVGKKFTENILLEAPVCTIIPGEASYLPGAKDGDKISTASALIEGASGNFSSLKEVLRNNTDENLRLYDFKNNYTDYIKYVNVLCRAGAVFLDLDEEITMGGVTTTFQKFDWSNYRWNSDKKSFLSAVSPKKTVAEKTNGITHNSSKYEFDMASDNVGDNSGNLKQLITNTNFVQFYIDPDVSPSESISNTSGESMLKSAFDTGASTMKEIAFMANSGGISKEALDGFTEGSVDALAGLTSSILGENDVSSAISRVINLGGSVVQGHNIIIPNIYQNSSYQKNYSITVHLKSPYGTKLGYYLDIFVPMMHLLALAMPRQESANTFSSPFLVKAYVEGLFSCNLGLVESISINKVTETLSMSGLPTEVDVTLNVIDLYSDLSMTPSNEPLRFANNSSLIEFLATNCGMTLTEPNFKKKWENIVGSVSQAFSDIPGNIESSFLESIQRMIDDWTLLY